MSRRLDTPPDLGRRDSGLVLFGYVRVARGREGDIADAIAGTWDTMGLPSFGLRSFNVLLGAGGVLLVTQLSRLETRPDIELEAHFLAELKARAPKFDLLEVSAARPYRSTERRPNQPPPACYTRTAVTLADPSPKNQHRWVDAVLTANPTLSPEPGPIATHYYLTTDTTRVLALTEWPTAEAQRRSANGTDPTDVRGASTVTAISTDQYRFAFSLLPEMAEER